MLSKIYMKFIIILKFERDYFSSSKIYQVLQRAFKI